MSEYITIRQASDLTGKTYQAMNQAKQRGTLRSVMIGGISYTTKQWLSQYEKSNMSRTYLVKNGKRLYNKEEGRYTVHEASILVGVGHQRLYHMIRIGLIKSDRVGSYHIIRSEYISDYLANKHKKIA